VYIPVVEKKVPETERAPARRRFLKLAIVGGTLLATGSVVALFRTRGYEMPKEREATLVALSPWQFILIEQVARRIAAPDPEVSGQIITPDQAGVATFVDGYVAKMAPAMRRDLFRLFAYVEHVAPLGLKLSRRFTRLDAASQDRVLSALESSDNGLLRGGFDGLKSLVFMGYYRDPRTWKILDYAGPMIGRPEKGWW
jgi:Gluconate 2-dehydrogenase subunit 3